MSSPGPPIASHSSPPPIPPAQPPPPPLALPPPPPSDGRSIQAATSPADGEEEQGKGRCRRFMSCPCQWSKCTNKMQLVYAIECFTGIGRGRSVVAASFSLKGCYRRKARCTLFPATKITIRQSGVSSGLLRVSSVNDLADTRRLLISSLMVLNSLPSLTGPLFCSLVDVLP